MRDLSLTELLPTKLISGRSIPETRLEVEKGFVVTTQNRYLDVSESPKHAMNGSDRVPSYDV